MFVQSDSVKRWHLCAHVSNSAPSQQQSPSVQLDLDSGTICRLTSDSRTCHTDRFQTVAGDYVWSVGPKRGLSSLFLYVRF